jgi:Zn-dependent protease with chaperone function
VLSVPVTDPGTYYVVFDNRFSTFSAKRIQADIRFVHGIADSPPEEGVTRSATERERRIGGILGRLVEKLQALEKQLGTHQIRTPLYVGVVDDPAINAGAIWRRRAILVTRGTLEVLESLPGNVGDDVLAGVLAHELSHMFYRHATGNERQGDETGLVAGSTAEMITPVVGLAAAGLALDRTKSYDRVQEGEADVLGARLACAAGFNPSGALTYLDLLNAQQKPERLGFLKSRPAPVQRVQHLQGAIEKLDCPGVVTASASVRTPEDPAKQARLEKAQGELKILVSAISLFVAHAGHLPPDLPALTTPVQNPQGVAVGPFLAVLPTAPPGWSEYAYAIHPDGRFSVSTSGDDTTLTVP